MLKFKQCDLRKKYIDFNNEKRKNAANSFEKYFFKLMINSVYSKKMVNVWKKNSVRILNNEKDYLKYTGRATHITHKIFGKNYTAIHEIIPVLKLNKLISVGFTLLELSKWVNGWCMTSITTLLKNNLVLNCFYWHRQPYLRNKIRRCLWRIF